MVEKFGAVGRGFIQEIREIAFERCFVVEVAGVPGDASFGGWVGGLQFGDGGGDAVRVGRGDGDSGAEFKGGFCDAVADA